MGSLEGVFELRNIDHVHTIVQNLHFDSTKILSELNFQQSLLRPTVDGRNPKQPVDMANIPLFTRF